MENDGDPSEVARRFNGDEHKSDTEERLSAAAAAAIMMLVLSYQRLRHLYGKEEGSGPAWKNNCPARYHKTPFAGARNVKAPLSCS